MSLLFKEKQRFNQWWLWVPLIGIALIPVYGAYKQLLKGEPFGDNPMSDVGLVIFLLFMAAFVGFFWMMQLITEIDEDSIKIEFFPFVKKNIKWEEVQSAQMVDYGFVGGWGIRMGTKYGTVYNTRGRRGLAIELKSGKKFCVGTQREGELKEVIKRISRQYKF